MCSGRLTKFSIYLERAQLRKNRHCPLEIGLRPSTCAAKNVIDVRVQCARALTCNIHRGLVRFSRCNVNGSAACGRAVSWRVLEHQARTFWLKQPLTDIRHLYLRYASRDSAEGVRRVAAPGSRCRTPLPPGDSRYGRRLTPKTTRTASDGRWTSDPKKPQVSVCSPVPLVIARTLDMLAACHSRNNVRRRKWQKLRHFKPYVSSVCRAYAVFKNTRLSPALVASRPIFPLFFPNP